MYNRRMEIVLFGIRTIAPIFLIILIGILFRHLKILNENLTGGMTRLVYILLLPALIIRAIAKSDIRSLFSGKLVLVLWGTLLASQLVAWLVSWLFGADRRSRGLFSSGASWGNLVIVGYALGNAVYGEEGVALAALVSALLMPLHNVLAVFSMSGFQSSGEDSDSRWNALLRILKNPVLISIAIGLILSLSSTPLPGVISDLLDILGRASLTLALLAIGGSLRFSKDSAGWAEPVGAALMKLLFMPALAFFGARMLGLENEITGIVVLMFACPTAVSFFVVSRSMGYDPSRGAAIVTITTLGSALSAGIVAGLLKWLCYV